MATLLVVTILLPLAGALLTCGAGQNRSLARWIALVISLATAGCALLLAARYSPASGAFATTDIGWLSADSGIDIRWAVGLDGLSIWMFALSAVLVVTCVLISWEDIRDRPGLYYGMLLLLECGCLGVFAARDIILFYIFFEFTLIPLFFLIGIWGSEERRYAAMKFFVYTLAGSLLTFLGLLALVWWDYSGQPGTARQLQFSIPALTQSLAARPLEPLTLQVLIFVALFAGFAIKVPLFPLHTWLPLAHVQAPAAGSVLLAGILLKIGMYGFLRFSLPMLPQATALCMPWLLWLAVAGILYGALVALAQADMKRLIAYSSVSHLGFCVLGLFSVTQLGVQGAALQMVNHGISTGALFALVGMLYERYHTRQISHLGGLAGRLPVLAFFMVLFTFASIGVPGLNGFAGEILILMGMFQRGWAESPALVSGQLRVIAVLAVSGVVLGAWYMLWLVLRVFFGPLRQPAHSDQVADLKWREVAALLPLAVLTFWIGIKPDYFLRKMAPDLSRVTIAVEQPLREAGIYRADAVDRLSRQLSPATESVTRAD
jgi:NADH-quinone oxidoreductase subunit M